VHAIKAVAGPKRRAAFEMFIVFPSFAAVVNAAKASEAKMSGYEHIPDTRHTREGGHLGFARLNRDSRFRGNDDLIGVAQIFKNALPLHVARSWFPVWRSALRSKPDPARQLHHPIVALSWCR
jgi:hypothetical protein